jgi:hypothetical protein
MPSIPPECQDFASSVQSLEAAEAAAKAALPGLVGADAWAALGRLASVREDLAAARSSLAACVVGHPGALAMQLVVVGAGPPPLPTSREALLYEPDQLTPTARSPFAGEGFSFAGPLPARFAILVVSQGLPETFVVDFRTGGLEASRLPPRIRAEVVVGPEVRFTSADITQWLSATALPVSTDLPATTSAGVSARVTVHSLSATLASGRFTLQAAGTVEWILAAGLAPQPSQFTVTLLLALELPQTPMDTEPCYVRVVGEPDVQVSGGLSGIVTAVLPLVRQAVLSTLQDQFQQVLTRGVARVVAGAFALAELPAGSRVSIRRLRVEEDAVTFQPAIGAMGTVLSTFQPP